MLVVGYLTWLRFGNGMRDLEGLSLVSLSLVEAAAATAVEDAVFLWFL